MKTDTATPGPSGIEASSESSPGRVALSVLLLLALLGVALYLPYFWVGELDDEEGRRAIPAREMLASDNFVMPAIWGHPYLAKPPLYFWAVAACASLTGGVNEAATRLPSVLATVFTALALYLLGRRLVGERPARFAALLFLCTVVVFEKGELGELEAVLGLFVFLGVAFLWQGVGGSRPATAASGLFIAAALMTKGPPVLVFYLAAVVGLVRSGPGRSCLRCWRTWVPLLVGLATLGVWVLLLLKQPGIDGVFATWGGEVARAKNFSWWTYLVERVDYLLTVPLGFYPGSFVCLAVVGTPLWRRAREEPLFRFVLPILAIVFVVFLVVPGTRTRYAYPLVPWCCLLAGRILDLVSVDSADRSALGRLRIPAYVAVALGALAALVPLYLHFHPISGIDHLTPPGYVVVAVILVATGIVVIRLRTKRSRLPLLAVFVVLALLRLLQITEIKPARALSRPRAEMARHLEHLVPESETLHTNIWGHFNTLFYLRRSVRYVESPSSVEAGALLLVDREVKARLDREPRFRAETLLETRMTNGQQVALLRRRAEQPAEPAPGSAGSRDGSPLHQRRPR